MTVTQTLTIASSTTLASFLAALLALLFSAQAAANPTSCESGDLSRKIEVVYSDPGQAVPCEVIYDKSAEGSMESLWQASHESGYCEAKAEGLIEKLRGMGWTCADAAPEQ
jgi:hypothetical protein